MNKQIYIIQQYHDFHPITMVPIAATYTAENIEQILDEYTRGTIIKFIPHHGIDGLHGVYYYLSETMDEVKFYVYKTEMK